MVEAIIAAVQGVAKAAQGIMNAKAEVEQQRHANREAVADWLLEAAEMERDYHFQHGILERRYNETVIAARGELLEANRKASYEQGRLEAAVADSGLSGNSMDRLFVENAMSLGVDTGAITSERDNQLQSVNDQIETVRYRNRPPSLRLQKPDVKGAFVKGALSALSGAAEGASTYASLNGGFGKGSGATSAKK